MVVGIEVETYSYLNESNKTEHIVFYGELEEILPLTRQNVKNAMPNPINFMW